MEESVYPVIYSLYLSHIKQKHVFFWNATICWIPKYIRLHCGFFDK